MQHLSHIIRDTAFENPFLVKLALNKIQVNKN